MDTGLRDRPLVYVDDLDHPALADGDRRHLERVRRLDADAAITVGDGDGRFRVARLGDDALVDLGPIEMASAPLGAVTLAFAPVKGDRPEWVVQKLTELGVDRIVILATERSVVRWDPARWVKQERKLATTIRTAGAQSRRLRLPHLDGPWSVERVRRELPGLCLAEIGAPALVSARDGIEAVAIGPEGGWSPAELAGGRSIGLGDSVLRAETACLAAAALLTIR